MGSIDPAVDYIVVGGGTAGLTVASRLSEDPDVRVLVIEAGGDHSDDPVVTTPGLLTAQYGNEEYDWNFLSTPQVRVPAFRTAAAEGQQPPRKSSMAAKSASPAAAGWAARRP